MKEVSGRVKECKSESVQRAQIQEGQMEDINL